MIPLSIYWLKTLPNKGPPQMLYSLSQEKKSVAESYIENVKW